MKLLELDVVATRGGDVESRHRVHAAVVGPDDTVVAGARDVSLVSSWRSCAKPFQVMPFLEAGGFDVFDGAPTLSPVAKLRVVGAALAR